LIHPKRTEQVEIERNKNDETDKTHCIHSVLVARHTLERTRRRPFALERRPCQTSHRGLCPRDHGDRRRASLYDFGPIGELRIAEHNAAMRKPFTLLMSAVCLYAFLSFAPAAPGQATDPAAKLQALSQQLKLTPQQKMQMLPILKEEGPKLEAVKNDASLSGMQKMRQLRAIHNETAPQLQKILSPAQYQQLQAIRQQEIQQAIAKKRAGR